MKIYNIKLVALSLIMSFTAFNCSDNEQMESENNEDTFRKGSPFLATYMQEDQMGRPAVNTVFVSSASKDMFNTTIPSEQNDLFQAMFQSNLVGLSPAYTNPGDANALGLDATTFTGLLATDVLNVSLDGETTFFNPNSGALLTGRNLTDDVITVELILIFGGETGLTNPEYPTLSNDNVDANDKAFLSGFPYLASPW